MARVDIDTSEVRRLSADLTRASQQAAAGVRPMVTKGAMNMKAQLVQEMSASSHFKGAASGISFELVADRDGLEAHVGPESSGPGALANIAYFGTSRGGGTVPDPQGALDAELPRFERAVGDLLGDLL